MTRLNRTVKRMAVLLVIVVLTLAVGSMLVFQSGWFQERVRARILRELEDGTGGRVELGNFSFDWRTLEATVAPLILHGTESGAEPPLVRIEKATIGLRIISALERRVDLASVRLDRPAFYIAIYPDGSNNFPVPSGGRTRTSWAEDFVNLAVRRYEVIGGVVEFDARTLPINLRGEDLRLAARYEIATKRYVGELASHRVHMALAVATPAELDLAATFALERDRLSFSRLRVATGQSRADLTGSLTDLRAPTGKFRVKALVAARDAAYTFSLPLQPTGSATAEGTLSVYLGATPNFTLDVNATARGLGYIRDRVNIRDATASGGVVWNPEGVTVKGLQVEALDARFTGNTALTTDLAFHLGGNYEGLKLSAAANAVTARTIPWNAILNGAITLDTGKRGSDVRIDLDALVNPVAGVPSLDGHVGVHYDQQAANRAEMLRFDDSRLTTGSTTIEFSGTPGESLDVRARSSNLDDVVPAFALLDWKIPQPVPIKEIRGEVSVNGTLSGALDNLRFHGDASLAKASVQGHAMDRLAATVDASAKDISLRGLDFARGSLQVQGDVAVTARDGSFADGAIAARLDVHNASLPELLKEAGIASDVRGTATVSGRVSGTVKSPDIDATVDVAQAAALGEQFERVRGNVRYANDLVRFDRVEATLGAGRIAASGSYQAAGQAGRFDWKHGDLRLAADARGVAIGRVAWLRSLSSNVEGNLDGKFSLRARLDPDSFSLSELNGEGSARRLTVFSEPLGDITATAMTRGTGLTLQASAKFLEASLHGEGTWKLEGDMPGSATLQFSRLTIAALHDLVMLGASEKEKSAAPPFEGFLEGGATVNVPLRKLDQFQAEAKIETVQFAQSPSKAPRKDKDLPVENIVLRNAQPVVVDISSREARVRSAIFVARDTNLEVTGAIPLNAPAAADLTIKGGINLAILQLLNPDLEARGEAAVNASIRGSVRNPQVNGRLELKNAALYLNGLPSGIDSAKGVILFDRNRATIDTLVAETGGGRVALSGFLEFATPLIYRLQADVRQVRVRYPEDVSTTGNAQLSLYGTSEASTLSGTLTLTRAAISARADLGKLLAASTRPGAAQETNEYLNGVRFDVRIQSAPNMQLETSLTRDVQASADLRLRGTPTRPVLLGQITVNSGEVQVFGNRYSINRGEIRFLNPVRIEPTLDVNLETSTRGITVNVSLSGSPQKLNVNYSSDPPLQSRDIIALLAVGRDPSTTARASDFSTATNTTNFGDAGGILGQAVSEQLSNSLQRFFGASRLKIDPTMTGVDNLPEARLTFEQQVSRDINVTYITNLNRTQEQIVRLQWDLSPRWSAIAVRDSNGLFGVDLQFRKRFK
jgi:translocation and assembly module TamB